MNDLSSVTPSEIYENLTGTQVVEWITSHRIEDLYLDFSTAPKNFEDREERENLAKMISGFGNAMGGVIVWGVRAVKDADGIDAAQSTAPIREPMKFLSTLTGYSGSAVSPPLLGLRSRLLDDRSFAVTLVPENDGGPFMANLGVGRYYTRSGSSSLPMEHYQVLDALNRRRRPELRLVVEVLGSRSAAMIKLQNKGRISARAPYVELHLSSPWHSDSMRHGNIPRMTYGGGFNLANPRFCGDTTLVLHPGVTFEIGEVAWSGTSGDRPSQLKFGYSLACEDLPLATGSIELPWHAGSTASS